MATNPVASLPDRRQARRQAKLANILSEAWSLAQRDGLAAISLRDLAERVGLRQPSLYVYFASKNDLYDAMFADGYRQLLDYSALIPTSDDPRQDLADFAAALVQFSSDDIVRHQLLLQRTIPGFEPSPESYDLALEFYALASPASDGGRCRRSRAMSTCSPRSSRALRISRLPTIQAVSGGSAKPNASSRCFSPTSTVAGTPRHDRLPANSPSAKAHQPRGIHDIHHCRRRHHDRAHRSRGSDADRRSRESKVR